MRICPNCGGKRFIVGVHIVQEWIIDENEECEDVYSDCTDITHFADDLDIWTCYECGYEAIGKFFHVEE